MMTPTTTTMSTSLYVNGWDANIKFSASHFIPRHEKCGRLHGNVYAIHAKLYGELASDGMLMDFSIIKRELRRLADELDHKVLIPGSSELVKVTTDDKSVECWVDKKHYLFPYEDVVILDMPVCSAENLANHVLMAVLKNGLPENITEIRVGVDEGKGQGAWIEKKL